MIAGGTECSVLWSFRTSTRERALPALLQVE